MKPNISVPLEIKSLEKREFDGHGSIFKNVDLGGDIVLPGVFKRTLSSHRKAGTLPQMFWIKFIFISTLTLAAVARRDGCVVFTGALAPEPETIAR